VNTENRSYWSDCGQIFFLDGWAYGLTVDLANICFGKETDILKALEGADFPPDMLPQARRALIKILEYREVNGFGTGENSVVGDSNDRATGGKQKTTRQPTPAKRLALRSSKQKSKNIFRR